MKAEVSGVADHHHHHRSIILIISSREVILIITLVLMVLIKTPRTIRIFIASIVAMVMVHRPPATAATGRFRLLSRGVITIRPSCTNSNNKDEEKAHHPIIVKEAAAAGIVATSSISAGLLCRQYNEHPMTLETIKKQREALKVAAAAGNQQRWF